LVRERALLRANRALTVLALETTSSRGVTASRIAPVCLTCNLRQVTLIQLLVRTTLFLRELLELKPVALERGVQLSILLAQLSKLPLSVVLFLLALFQLMLCVLNFFLDICQEQILVQ